MTTAICVPDDDNVRRSLADDETKELTPVPKHVQCSQCHAWNHPAARFCIFCGKPFDNKCPGCGQ